MLNLIVGSVTSSSARIWVRGSAETPFAFLDYGQVGGQLQTGSSFELEERHGFTRVIELTGLTDASQHQCSVSFGRNGNTPVQDRISFSENSGTFTTAPAIADTNTNLTFLAGSCNLHSLGIVTNPDRKFRTVSGLIDTIDPSFMIHCGDQIYADIILQSTSIEDYRGKYLDAWDDSDPTRKVLTKLPHYMILDDHEITNNFTNDADDDEHLKSVALKVYREFVHIRNPQSYGPAPLYYNFNWGDIHFFVLDVRTERYQEAPDNQIIGEEQMERFKDWLNTHANERKIVVTSVPFVGQVRSSKDKWCSEPYKHQREEIIEFLQTQNIRRIAFLTGDMHNSYHAKMMFNGNDGSPITVHELMTSPINQLGKSSKSNYRMDFSSTTTGGVAYTSVIDPTSFYGDHSNIMSISLEADATGSTVRYEIFRTSKAGSAKVAKSFDF